MLVILYVTHQHITGLEANQLIGSHETISQVEESTQQNACELHNGATQVENINDNGPDDGKF